MCATRLYPGNDTAQYDPATERGAWDLTVSHVVHRLARRKSGNGTSIGLTDTNVTNNWDRLLIKLVSDPLEAQTISGTIDFMLLAAETDAAANMVLHAHIYVTQGDSDTPRGTILTDHIDSQEWAVYAANHDALSITGVALSSLAVSAGDRIVIELGFQAQNTVTTPYTGRLKYGGPTSDATGSETNVAAGSTVAPWVEFSDDLTFTWDYLYLTNDAPAVSPGADRGTWDDVTTTLERHLAISPSGANTLITKAETTTTNPWDILSGIWLSDALAAQTIDQPIRLMHGMIEGGTGADAFCKYHLYVMASDGSVRGTLLTDQVAAAELNTLAYTIDSERAISSVAAQAGDRIVLEVGARFTNVTAVSQQTSLHYGGSPAEKGIAQSALAATDTSPYIRFGQHLLYQVVGTGARSQSVIVG